MNLFPCFNMPQHLLSSYCLFRAPSKKGQCALIGHLIRSPAKSVFNLLLNIFLTLFMWLSQCHHRLEYNVLHLLCTAYWFGGHVSTQNAAIETIMLGLCWLWCIALWDIVCKVQAVTLWQFYWK